MLSGLTRLKHGISIGYTRIDQQGFDWFYSAVKWPNPAGIRFESIAKNPVCADFCAISQVCAR